MSDTKLADLPALAAVTTPANLLFYVVDLDEALDANQDKKAALTILDNRFQAKDADLTAIAALSAADGNFIVGDGATWVVESGATVRTSLGLGTIAVLNSPLPIINGGSGQVTQQAAIDALTNVAAATNEHVLTKDTGTGNAIFKAAPATGAPVGATYIVQTPDATLTNEQALSALATGLLKNTTATGVLSIAAEGTDYFNPPFLDTNTLIKGSADPTKLLRFEIDGFAAGATRVMTPPNQDTLLAGQDFANVFTVAQTIRTSGTSVVVDVDADDLVIRGETHAGMSIISGNASAAIIYFGDDDDNLTGVFAYSNLNKEMEFSTQEAGAKLGFYSGNGSLAITVDSSQRVGIGKSILAAKLTVSSGNSGITPDALADELLIEGNGHTGMTIISGNAQSAIIYFGDSDSSLTGAFAYSNLNKEMEFSTAESGAILGFYSDNGLLAIRVDSAQRVGIGTPSPLARLHVKQPSTTAANPTVELEQLDLSEEFFNFVGTVATGNPIEDVGAKTLTTTHFIRVAVNGSFLYFPVGTIA